MQEIFENIADELNEDELKVAIYSSKEMLRHGNAEHYVENTAVSLYPLATTLKSLSHNEKVILNRLLKAMKAEQYDSK